MSTVPRESAPKAMNGKKNVSSDVIGEVSAGIASVALEALSL